MGINYYGKCSGASGSKYDLWIALSQNSQNVSGNTSNVTARLLLKRNDGYSASAYNLSEDSNTARLTVGGSVKVNKKLAIDTRNGATVTLAQWTGNVTHNSDGTLSLPVKGEFTIGSTNLTGGSVTCEFKCTAIPRASGLSLSASSISPEGSLKVSVESNSETFTHRLIWSVGNASASTDMGAGASEYTLKIPVNWAEQVTTSAKGSLKITLKTYNKGVQIGSVTKSIPFTMPASADFTPQFGIALERINKGVSTGIDEYIKGVSQLKVDLSDVTFKYGATLQSVSITLGSVSKRSAPATFEITESGVLTVSVTLKDSRGFAVKKTKTITVCDYQKPDVNIKSIERCDVDGTLNNQGKYLIMHYDFNYSDLNSKNTYEVMVGYRAPDESYYGDVYVNSSPVIFGGDIEESSSYEVRVRAIDEICEDYVEFIRSVGVAHIPFNIRRGGNGAAFGKFAENENELSVAWDVDIQGSLSVGGELNFDDLSVETTDKAKNLLCTAKHIPPLKMVWLGLRLETATELSANTSHVVAGATGKAPAFFTPLQCVVHFSSDVKALGGIQNTGEIVVRPENTISAGTQIYLSGCYIC
ncbi:MAG: hypothetical protein IKT55_03055 [Clostridia bacterium]|nr:hypothetical protein [Clostridia bacterium]